MAKTRRIKVKGVRRTEGSGEDVEMLSLVLWLQAKRLLSNAGLTSRPRERKLSVGRARAAMNADLLSLVAAGGGSTMIAGIAAFEHKQAERMRASRVILSTRYPMNLEAAQISAAWESLAGLPYTTELIAEILATEGSITHSLLVPQAACESVRSTLTGVIPSLRLADAPPPPSEAASLSLRLFVPTSILKADNVVSASRSLLTGLAGLRASEKVAIRWALSPGRAPSRRQVENPTLRQREIERALQGRAISPDSASADWHSSAPRRSAGRGSWPRTSRTCCAAVAASLAASV